MRDFNAFVSPEYPVIHTVVENHDAVPGDGMDAMASISLALLVGGIPSFLSTIMVDRGDLRAVRQSLDGGDVRVAVVGMSVGQDEVQGAQVDSGDEQPAEAWKPLSFEESQTRESLPAAFLSLVCADGRKIGVARIVARAGSASPEDVARYVLRQIAEGVQIPDLASAP